MLLTPRPLSTVNDSSSSDHFVPVIVMPLHGEERAITDSVLLSGGVSVARPGP